MHALLTILAYLFMALSSGAPSHGSVVDSSVLDNYQNDVVVRLLACQYQSRCTVDDDGISVCALKWHCPRSIDP